MTANPLSGKFRSIVSASGQYPFARHDAKSNPVAFAVASEAAAWPDGTPDRRMANHYGYDEKPRERGVSIHYAARRDAPVSWQRPDPSAHRHHAQPKPVQVEASGNAGRRIHHARNGARRIPAKNLRQYAIWSHPKNCNPALRVPRTPCCSRHPSTDSGESRDPNRLRQYPGCRFLVQTPRRLRPLARRARITARPPFVRMRTRKP